MVAAAVGTTVAGIAGSAMSSSAASDAADQQSQAAQQASALQQANYQQTRSDLQPFTQSGYNALNSLSPMPSNAGYLGAIQDNIPLANMSGLTGSLPTYQNNSVVPQNMTQDQLEATPGYQFTLSQGLKATQSAAAARGLGVSGAALKGAASYATGLADNTYQNQFAIQQQQFADQLNKDSQNYNQQQTNFNDQYNINNTLFNQGQSRVQDYTNMGTFDQNWRNTAYNQQQQLANLGESAAAMTGSYGQQSANAQGTNLMNAANAQGAAGIANANSWSGALNNAANSYSQYNIMNRLFGNNPSDPLSSNYNSYFNGSGFTA